MDDSLLNIRIDKDHDLIFCSVGLYKMFLANKSPGMEAKQLYDHLLFTARLQETSIIHANTSYLQKGLGWGQAKIKRAKAFLTKKGLISYVQRRGPNGQMMDWFIQVNFFRREPQIEETYDPDRAEQLALFGFMTGGSDATPLEKTEDKTTGTDIDPVDTTTNPSRGTENDPPDENSLEPSGSEIDPVDLKPKQATGMADRPMASHTYGYDRQMLKIRKEMLKERKRNEEPSLSDSDGIIIKAFYQAYIDRFGYDPAQLTGEELKLIETQVSRFGVGKLLTMLQAFFTDRVKNVASFAEKAGYRYKVFSSQIEALAMIPPPQKAAEKPEELTVCPECGHTEFRSTTDVKMCLQCRAFYNLEGGKWIVDPESLEQDANILELPKFWQKKTS
mgnify:CR=1 FL=1